MFYSLLRIIKDENICQVWNVCFFSCLGSVVTRCEACNKHATCISSAGHEGNGFSPLQFNCVCKDGYLGNGLECLDRVACSADMNCCHQGYQWTPDFGCVDIDECSSSVGKSNPCPHPTVCENTAGSFSCVMTPALESSRILPHRAEAEVRSVQFGCGSVVCPVGQDCLSINGNATCADPCQHYTTLNQLWRSTDYRVESSSPACDSSENWQGWYRLFLGTNSIRMPERCVERYMCGTDVPLWLATPHPDLHEGVVRGRVCGSWESDCCQYSSNSIHVKACPGNYHVYKLVSSSLCFSAYCAGRLYQAWAQTFYKEQYSANVLENANVVLCCIL